MIATVIEPLAAWIAIGIVVALISIYAIIRKGFTGIPLVIGVWWLYFTAMLAVTWFPPTPPQTALLAFMTGVSLALIIWGLANIMANILAERPLYVGANLSNEFFITAAKQEKSPYGVLYGCVPWNAEGAGFFANFLREEIWAKGYKLTHLQVERDERGGRAIAWIWGIVRPKTIIDRILY